MLTESVLASLNRSVKSGLVIVAFLLAGIFLWLAVKDVDPYVLKTSLMQSNGYYLAPVVAALILFYLLKVHRWRALMPTELRFGYVLLLTPMMLGFAANNIFPLRLGEFVRVYCAGRILRLPKSLIFGTMVVERLFDFAAIAFIVLIGLVIILVDRLAVNINAQLLVTILVLILAGIIYAFLFWFARRDLSSVTKFLPTRWQDRAHKLLVDFAKGITAVDNSWQFFTIFLNSIIQWLLMAACIYFSMLALSMAEPSFVIATTILALIVFGISLPAAPAFIGTIEYAFVFGLGLFGYSATLGIAIAIYYHLLTFGFVMLAGLASLIYYRVAIRTQCQDSVAQ